MPFFFLKLHPPRPTFAHDMSADERALMLQHVAYMKDWFTRGKVLVYGPVLDPESSFGMAVMDATDEAEVQQLIAGDPTIQAGLNHYTFAPMMVGGAQAPRSPSS